MKFDVIERKIETAGAIKSKAVSISANAKAFRIIFGQIYPDIIKAIVRELFTNAWDSQKKADNIEKPIEIHIPTSWEPWFSIRDFGTGMTPQIIDDIYSNVFESTKDSSDDEAGMFGMGSKTPLGYTDAFSVTSYIDGYYWVYSIFMDETGSPVIALQAEGEADEPNGVEVMLSVKHEDFDTFKEHVEHFALNAGTPVNINREKFLNQRQIVLRGTNWTLYKEGNESFIRMGCVLYRIDSSFIANYIDYDTRKSIANKPFIFDFDIGAFGVTGSREDIIYNAEAGKKIVDAIAAMRKELKVQLLDKINNADTYMEAYESFLNVNRAHSLGISMASAKWGALSLNTHQKQFKKVVEQFKKDTTFCLNPSNARSGIANRFVTSTDLEAIIHHGNSTLYVVMDDETATSPTSRMKNFFTTLIKKMSYVNSYNYGNKREFQILWIRTKRDFSEFKRLHPFLPKATFVINLKDIDKAPVEKRAPREKSDTAFYVEIKNNDPVLSSHHIDLEDGQYYVKIDKRNLFANHTEADIRAAMQGLGAIGDENITVFAIGKSNAGLIDDYNLVDLFEAYRKKVDTIDYEDDIYIYCAAYNVCEAHYDDWNYAGQNKFTVDQARAVSYIIGHKIEPKCDGAILFNPTVNKTVADKYDVYYNDFKSRFDALYERHPILEIIPMNTFYHSATEILEKLGEMKSE